ncbi:MAG TPA: hypothetical protein H9852_07060 [Candidatus Mediterraneibacter colneyensis]|nr:hypothetical protein [Candidatus Mediterraneibacter colneyensis]
MIFRKEVYVTRDMDAYNRARNVLEDNGIRYTSKSGPVTNPGRHHGVPFINADAAYEYHLYVPAKEAERAVHVLREMGL